MKSQGRGPDPKRQFDPEELAEIERRARMPGFTEALCRWSADHPDATILEAVEFARSWHPESEEVR